MTKKNKVQGKSESTNAPTAWVGDTFSGSAGGHTGHLEMRWLRSGNSLAIQTLRYMITGNGTRNKANINIIVHAHYGKEWKLDSNDRKQDGTWHTWDTNGTLDLGNATHITVKVVFIFDLGGPDDRATIIREYAV